MLVSATEMLKKAKAGHYAVGQFNINNLEWTKSILLTAQELKSPVILGVSEGAGKYMTGFKTVAAMVKAMDEELGITVPVAPAVLYKYSAEMAEFLSDPEGQKTKDHVPDVHCDTGPVPESVLLPH